MIVEKWLHKDNVCIIHQHKTIERLICGYVGIDAEHPLYGVGYDEETPVLVEMLAVCAKYRKKHDVIELLKGHSADNWFYTMEDFTPSPEGYFIKYGLTFSGQGDIANLREFNCPAIWFFGFDSGHPGEEWEFSTKENLRIKMHIFCEELSMELDLVKSAKLFPGYIGSGT
jgi:hypothetical protein